ncbi:MAG: endo-1,4-beta-xylanase, partial [Tannerella sp.]|nr:endo-1,4-beta-xylanase [Tannerella sp.]
MKIKNSIYLLLVALSMSFNSCYDTKMEWGDPYTHPAEVELPLPLQEAISRYDVLKAYTGFKVGAGIGFDMYGKNEAFRNIVNQNFTEITPGNEMKQSSLMSATGVLNFATADAMVDRLKSAGLAIYGHTLVWHTQQQAGYLKSLIAPTIIMPPAGSNLLENGSFEDGMTGWGQWGGGSTNEIVTEGTVDGEKALKINIPNAGDTWSVQLRTPAVPTIVGHQYEVSFFIRSEEQGAVRLSIGAAGQMSNRWPQHQNAIPGSKDNILLTTSAWQQIVFSTNTIVSETPWVAEGESVQFDLDLGQVAGVYYIDNVVVTDLDAVVDGNLLSAGGFESGDLAADGWQAKNAGAGIEITTGETRTGTYAVKLTASATSKNDWDLQMGAPSVPVTPGNRYEISFYIKSNVEGKGRLSFGSSMSNNYPYVNGAREFVTTTDWTRVVYSPETVDPDWTPTADALQIDFDLGLVPDVTYYIDDVTVIDMDATPGEVNLVENGNFETGEITPWLTPNPGAGITVTADAKSQGKYGLQGIAGTGTNEWDLQFQTPTIPLDATKTYTMSFWIKSDIAGQGRISFAGLSNNYPWINWDGTGAVALFNTTSNWKYISFDIPEQVASIMLSFDLGKVPGATYFVDDVKLIEKPEVETASAPKTELRAGPITIEKTPEEKFAILEPVFINYIKDVTTHFKGKIAAWDVVNEPMSDGKPSSVKSASEKTEELAADEFYWQDYLGKDYAVTAFKTAQAADPDAKLFINDYNLEYSLAKCDGLIEYVKYIEEQGARVDGIGTQMHVSLTADRNN